MSTYRTFIAIEIPPDIRRRINDTSINFAPYFQKCAPVDARRQSASDAEVPRRCSGRAHPRSFKCGAAAAHQVNPFDLVICDCGMFPPHAARKVLWIGCADVRLLLIHLMPGAGRLVRIFPSQHPTTKTPCGSARRPRRSCAAAGFEREPRSFTHTDIARLRESKVRDVGETSQTTRLPAQTFTVSNWLCSEVAEQ